jgi:hypothetical protein
MPLHVGLTRFSVGEDGNVIWLRVWMLEARVRELEQARCSDRVWNWIELILYGIIACVYLARCVGSSED